MTTNCVAIAKLQDGDINIQVNMTFVRARVQFKKRCCAIKGRGVGGGGGFIHLELFGSDQEGAGGQQGVDEGLLLGEWLLQSLALAAWIIIIIIIIILFF